ncbi:hypothetical protein [Ochrobactrum sp. CGA5]|uniref:hypothetical protein n=1 Tax=Ochrobactrum sp. CGA5 TaxID=2583453 RepID=UPI00111E0C61|nr:hypothetical protein [Ochrobactrum sp. CGA5]
MNYLQIAHLVFLVAFSGLGFWILGTERGASDALRLLDRICPSDSPSTETATDAATSIDDDWADIALALKKENDHA